MDAKLAGRWALVTGGNRGIGLGIARALAAEGANLVLASRSDRPKAVEELRASGVAVQWIGADVSSESGAVAMIGKAWEIGDISLYVNNAAGSWHEPITQLTASAWERTLSTNLGALAFAGREVARRFIAQRQGSILVIGSTAAHVPLYREAAYSVSKAGLKALVRILAIELAPYGLRANLLTPGGFQTDLMKGVPGPQSDGSMVPWGRLGRVPELGPSAVLLLSDALSPYTTGAELVVDGGFRLRPLKLYSADELREMNAVPKEAEPGRHESAGS